MSLTRDENGKVEFAIDNAIGTLQATLIEEFPDLAILRDGCVPNELIPIVRAAMRVYAEQWLQM